MLSSVLTFHSKPPSPRSAALKTGTGPPLPPRRHSLSTAPATPATALQRTSVTLSAGMDSRYHRPSSPRGRYANPARSSTGTFADPYYDSAYYAYPTSPRASGERMSASSHQAYYPPSSASGSRSSNVKHDSHASRPRRNTNDLAPRPNVSSLTSLPVRSGYTPHGNLERPASPLAKSWDTRGDAYTGSGQSRQGHKKVYSVDDNSRKAQLVAERDIVEPPRHRDSADRGYSLTSGGRTYHSTSKAPARLSDLGDDGYSYTDPASMYRDTEPAWRRPRAGSLERGARPTSMILDRPARSSARELGPPPSTRGFDKIHSGIPRSHGRSSSIDKPRDVSQYDYPDTAPTRSSSTRHHAPAIHQEPRRETYHDEYDRRDRDVENRRHSTADRFEDREVASRGFGIAQGNPSLTHEHHALDRQPIWPAHEGSRARPEERAPQHYSTDRAPPGPGSALMPEPRLSRDRDLSVPQDSYDRAPREREGSRHESKGFIPAAAGAAAGVAAASYAKTRETERGREGDRDLPEERERDRRREHDERDKRERYEDRREDRRDRRPDERRDIPPAPAAAPVAGYAPREDDRKPRERRYENDERDRPARKANSSEGSGDERPRHYVDRDTDRRKEAAPKEAALDPDEEYRRRIQQEAERSSSRTTRDNRDRNDTDADRDQDRRRRKDDRDRSRGPEESSRYDERSSSLYDSNLVQEPESLEGALVPASKSVQIVEPAKEPPPAVRGILRKPTEKFPEDPDPIREGVAPHKDSLKGREIPQGARWTRIDRRLVNPEALEQAKERFEERMDCVIVLRVLTKQEIQKLADRTKKIREAREEEDRQDREDRDDKRGHRSSRDDRDDEDRDRDHDRERDRDRDRERRRRHDDDDDYDNLDREYKREREPERDRPKMLEPARKEKTSKGNSKPEYKKHSRGSALPPLDWKTEKRKFNLKDYDVSRHKHLGGRDHGLVDGADKESKHRDCSKNLERRDSATVEDDGKDMKRRWAIKKVLGWL